MIRPALWIPHKLATVQEKGEALTLRRSQNKKIACYLKSGRSLTQQDAIDLFGIYRLPARIFDLREHGMDIKTIMHEKEVTDPETGDKLVVRYAEYKYEGQ